MVYLAQLGATLIKEKHLCFLCFLVPLKVKSKQCFTHLPGDLQFPRMILTSLMFHLVNLYKCLKQFLSRLTTLTEKTQKRTIKHFVFQKQLFQEFITEGHRQTSSNRWPCSRGSVRHYKPFFHMSAEELFSFDFHSGFSACPMHG